MQTSIARLNIPLLGLAASLSLTQANAQLNTLKEFGQTFVPLATDPGTMGGDTWYDTSAKNSSPASGRPHGFTGPSGAGEYTITAGGVDFYDQPCRGSFLYQASAPQTGDFSAIVRSVSVAANPDEVLGVSWGRSGIMARVNPADPSADRAPYAFHFRRSGGTSHLQTRDDWWQGTGEVSHNNNAATVPPRTTALWMGLHRKNNVWYSTWAPDNAGSPGTWSQSIQRDPGPAPLDGPVFVGLAHQAHWEATNHEINTALFDNFSVGSFNSALGEFPLTTFQSVTFSGNNVFLSAYGIEMDDPTRRDVSWSVAFIAPAIGVVPPVPGLLANIYASGNNDGNWNNLVNNTLGVPDGKVVIPNANWANPGAGNPPNGYPDGDPNPDNGNSSTNLFETAVPQLGFELGGDGANDYGVHLTGEIFIPSDADRDNVESVRFHEATDDRAFLEVDGVVLINRNGWAPWNGNDGDAQQAILDVSDAKYNDGEWVTIRVGMWEGGGGDNVNLVWDALDTKGTDSTTGAVDDSLGSYGGDLYTDGPLRFFHDVSDIVPQKNLRTIPPPVPTISSGFGQPNGTVPLNVTLTKETTELRVSINGQLKLIVPAQPSVQSAKFTGQDQATIVLADVGTGGSRDVDTNTLVVTRNGNAITPAISKSGVLTTLVDTDFTEPDPYTNYTYVVTGSTTAATGSVPISLTTIIRSWPILAELDDGLSTPPNASVGWDLVEYDASQNGGLGGGEDMFRRAQLAILNRSIRPNGSGQVPYINHRDPEDSPQPFSGDWSGDMPILSNTVPVPPDNFGDNQYVMYARTIVTIGSESDRTFRIRGDDGYGLRVTGATFTSVAGNGTNRIHPDERSSVFFPDGTGNSDAFAVCHFPAAGDYLVEFFGFEGGGGAFQEISWAPGSFTALSQTRGWVLLGDTTNYVSTGESPFGTIPASVMPALPSTPGWATHFWYDIQNPQPWNLGDTFNFLRAVGAENAGFNGDTTTVEAVLNHGGGGQYGDNLTFPDNNTGIADRSVMIAHARIIAPVTGDYTIQVRSDDGFMLRWDNAGDTFHTLNGLGTLHPNNQREAFFADGTGDSNTRVSAHLTAGAHDIVFVWWNGNGGSYFEVSAAPGVVANHAAPPFELLSTTPSLTNLYIGAAGGDDFADTWGPAQSWTFGGPLTGKNDDYDGDGLSNDKERAFGLDPTKGSSVSPITVPLDKVTGTFTYTRRTPSLANLTCTYQWSTTLATWTTVVPAVADIVTPIAGTDNQSVIVNLTGAPGNPLSNDKLFVRVKAE